jgi:hypothetical protein
MVAPASAGAQPRLRPMLGSIFAPTAPLTHLEVPAAAWSADPASETFAPSPAPRAAMATRADPVAHRPPPPAENGSVLHPFAPVFPPANQGANPPERDLLPSYQPYPRDRDLPWLPDDVVAGVGESDTFSQPALPEPVSRDRAAASDDPLLPPVVAAPRLEAPPAAAPVPAPRVAPIHRAPGGGQPQAQWEPDEIHIHIGRIEVAAIAPPAPRPAPVRKSLSLDEYLRRGNGRQG